jgi:hypothetical protein
MQQAHLASLEREVETGRMLCTLHGAPPAQVSSMNTAIVEIDESFLRELPSASQLYELIPNSEDNTLELDRTGETLHAPYSFIAGLRLIREEIYDKGGA